MIAASRVRPKSSPTTVLIQLGGTLTGWGTRLTSGPKAACSNRLAIHTSRPRGPTSSLGKTVTSSIATPKVTARPISRVIRALRALPGWRRAVNSARYTTMHAVIEPSAARLNPNRASSGSDG